jgi:hypothetical protein
MVGYLGVEPSRFRLKGGCSAVELVTRLPLRALGVKVPSRDTRRPRPNKGWSREGIYTPSNGRGK